MKALSKCTFLALMLGIGCASGQTKRIIPVGDVSKIELHGMIEVVLIQGNENKIEAVEEDKIHYEESGGTLSLSLKEKHKYGPVRLYLKDISFIEMSGASHLSSADTISTDKLKMDLSGASTLSFNLHADEITADISGASKMTLKGHSKSLKADITGASQLNAVDLQTKSAFVDASGVSRFTVNASEKLAADVSGMSKGEYKGHPIDRNIDISGNSTIHSIDNESTSTTILGDDTLKIKLGDRKITITEDIHKRMHRKREPKHMKHVWTGFELGVESFATPDLNFNMDPAYDYLKTRPGKSWFFGVNFLEYDVQIIKNRIALSSGFGLDWQNFRFEDNRYIRPNSKTMAADTFAGSISYNNWSTFNLSAPFLIKYNSRASKSSGARFHFAAGVIVSYSFQPDITIESNAKGYKEELTISDNFNYNPFRLTGTVRVGYGWLRLFANYGLTPVFDRSKAPDVRVCAVGMTLIPF